MNLTDNEIIKALECCTIGTFACGKECPYYSIKSNLKVTSCRFELMCELFDLINRLKAENERLKNSIKEADNYFIKGEIGKGLAVIINLVRELTEDFKE